MTIEKYGDAQNIDFGTDSVSVDGLDIVTSYSVENSYATELFLKDSSGATVGLIQGDARTTGTISGYGQGTSVVLGSDFSNPTSVGDNDCAVSGIRASGSNEDFTTYELSFNAFEGVSTTCDAKAKHGIEPLKDAPRNDELSELAYLVSELQR